ncbi:MAG: LPP20 family lipoprotein, partial [Candidatus Latescibacter sp.]|nr:LPP20 family lipoprotein [Candidatus Latescibacter sp.]
MQMNRKIASILVLGIAVAFGLSACGPKNISKGDVPDWYLNPPQAKDKIYGTGASEKSAFLDLATQLSDAAATQSLMASIQVSVQSMLRNYLQQSGTLDNVRALQFSESVSKTVVSNTLSGVIITKRESREGRMFSLAELSKDSMKNALLSAARDAAAEYSEL